MYAENSKEYGRGIEIDTLEYQQTEKIETELKDVDRIHSKSGCFEKYL